MLSAPSRFSTNRTQRPSSAPCLAQRHAAEGREHHVAHQTRSSLEPSEDPSPRCVSSAARGGSVKTVSANLSAEAQRATVEAQATEQTPRDRAFEFHKELVAFRRALSAVVGRRHMDCQTLRYRRALQGDETLEVVIDDAAPPVGASGVVSSDAVSAGALRLALAYRFGL